MATALAPRAVAGIEGFDPAKVALIKQTVARDTTDDQLALFLYTARTRGLDPLLGQIHAVVRNHKLAIQVGIDGLRLIAARTQVYMGNDEPVFVEGATHPLKATVTVWRLVAGQRCGFTDSAYWQEFYPGDGGDGFMWRKLPHVMLGKVAESRALRKAFPNETSGLYSDEEMHQADKGTVQVAQPPPPDLALIRRVDPVTAEVSLPAEKPAPALDYKATLTWLQKLPAADDRGARQSDALARLCDEKLPAEAARYGLALPERTADMDPAAWAAAAVMTLTGRDDSSPI